MARLNQTMPAMNTAIMDDDEITEMKTNHHHRIGQTVKIVSPRGMHFKNGLTFTVTAKLPPAGGALQYRIKNDDEPYERVVAESQLEPIEAPAE